ncbi:hypothetical protein BDW74DRAFT_181770 [Aspergillus multicolor]|uniref:uncharacterized protein n=1 Tax=Aspergillus multicolor TaxID=41759 RepID=UPI003CCDBD16
MNTVKLLLLGDSPSTTDFLHRFNRAAVARAVAAGTLSTPGTLEYVRECSISSSSNTTKIQVQVITRTKQLHETGELQCFEDNTGPAGIILIYDVTSGFSFEGVQKALLDLTLREELEDKSGECIQICVVGDTGILGFDAAERVVSGEEGRALAGRFGAGFVEVSTESGRDVDRVVEGVVRGCLGLGLGLKGDGISGEEEGEVREGSWNAGWGRALKGKISSIFRK